MDVGPRLVRIDFDLFSRYLLKREREKRVTNRFEAGWNVCERFFPRTHVISTNFSKETFEPARFMQILAFRAIPKWIPLVNANFHFGEIYAPKFALNPIVSRVPPLSRDHWTISAPGNESIDFCECFSSAHRYHLRVRNNSCTNAPIIGEEKNLVLEDCSISVG